MIDATLYTMEAESPDEAAYLSVLLNAPALKQAFREGQSSNHDFHLTPWKCVPIPRYDPQEKAHASLAVLACRAEKVTEAWFAAQPRPRAGQIALSNGIRAELAHDGILGEIDEIVRVLLPEQAR